MYRGDKERGVDVGGAPCSERLRIEHGAEEKAETEEQNEQEVGPGEPEQVANLEECDADA